MVSYIPLVLESLVENYSIDQNIVSLLLIVSEMMTNCTDLPCLDELFSNVTFLTNLVYVREELEKDPLFLLRPCVDGSPLLAQWTNLINFEPPQRVLDRLEDLGENYWLQTLESADGGLINMDYFSVNISQLPEKSPGVTMTSEEFLETVRQGWATEDFFGLNGKCALGIANGAEFIYNSPEDQQIWTSEDPTTSIFTIKMADDGSIITSDYNESLPCIGCWIFSTIHANGWLQGESQDGYHPVSGNRQFGLLQNNDGTYTFYNIGADRLTKFYHVIFGKLFSPIGVPHPFESSDELWQCANQTIVDFINNKGGSSAEGEFSTNSYDWNQIADILKSEQSINELPCLSNN